MLPIRRALPTMRTGLRTRFSLAHLSAAAGWRPPTLAANARMVSFLSHRRHLERLSRLYRLEQGRLAFSLPSLSLILRPRPAPATPDEEDGDNITAGRPASSQPPAITWAVRTPAPAQPARPSTAAGATPRSETSRLASDDLAAPILARHMLGWTSLLANDTDAPADAAAVRPQSQAMLPPDLSLEPSPPPAPPLTTSLPAAGHLPLSLILARAATLSTRRDEPSAAISPEPWLSPEQPRQTSARAAQRPPSVIVRSLAAALPSEALPAGSPAPEPSSPVMAAGGPPPASTSRQAGSAWPLLIQPPPRLLEAAATTPDGGDAAAAAQQPRRLLRSIQPAIASERATRSDMPALDLPLTPPVLPPAVSTADLPAPLRDTPTGHRSGTSAPAAVGMTWQPSYRTEPPPSLVSPAAPDPDEPAPSPPSGNQHLGHQRPSLTISSPTAPLTLRPQASGLSSLQANADTARSAVLLPLVVTSPPQAPAPSSPIGITASPPLMLARLLPTAPATFGTVPGHPIEIVPGPPALQSRFIGAVPHSPAVLPAQRVTLAAEQDRAPAARRQPGRAYPLVAQVLPPAIALTPAPVGPAAAGRALRPVTDRSPSLPGTLPGLLALSSPAPARGHDLPADGSESMQPVMLSPIGQATMQALRGREPLDRVLTSRAAALPSRVNPLSPTLFAIGLTPAAGTTATTAGLPPGGRVTQPHQSPAIPVRHRTLSLPGSATQPAAWAPTLAALSTIPASAASTVQIARQTAQRAHVAASLPLTLAPGQARPAEPTSPGTQTDGPMAPSQRLMNTVAPFDLPDLTLVESPPAAPLAARSPLAPVHLALPNPTAVDPAGTRPQPTAIARLTPTAAPASAPQLPIIAAATAEQAPALGELQRITGRGTPLPLPVRTPFERIFNTSFADVEIHADAPAAAVTRAAGAAAVTVGHRIFFAPGRFQPDQPEGSALLAHELTHVVQQRTSPIRMALKSLGTVTPVETSAAEQQAEQTEAQVLSMHHRNTFPAQPLVLSRAVRIDEVSTTTEPQAGDNYLGSATPSGPALGTSDAPALARVTSTGPEPAATIPQEPAGGISPADVEGLASRVYELIKDKLTTERERRGRWF